MAKTFERPSYPPPRVPDVLEPASASAAEALEQAREMARRYLLNTVLLWAAVAFGNSEASPW